jgi:hypothetical protein
MPVDIVVAAELLRGANLAISDVLGQPRLGGNYNVRVQVVDDILKFPTLVVE